MPARKPTPGTLRPGEALDLENLLGSTWAGFALVGTDTGQGQLVHAYWRRPFEAGELCALFYRCQQVEALEIKVRELEMQAARADALAEKAEARAEWYRKELRAASKLGLMFSTLDPG